MVVLGWFIVIASLQYTAIIEDPTLLVWLSGTVLKKSQDPTLENEGTKKKILAWVDFKNMEQRKNLWCDLVDYSTRQMIGSNQDMIDEALL